ncbi:polyprenyl synthetase family protein [Nannocystis sp. ILAH1]|uniref:polyprenyl synthetase family protein n=1 Tax=unclassified Nannocystis TaxID=2627009 RepID=UPI00226D6393|nr:MULTISPECIES: polyprenyl synthetase family protein [unclassified Nannocystis]MCY0988193.1 polyprenyl synthetase family protein [Nannocystis sp. ILAH1]MCY1067845.1 polyprenyl synthetase family protein [Nannocystis sp. RBIL2]
MTKTFELNAYLGERRRLVDEAIVRALPEAGSGDPGRLKEGMRYAVLQGGKRMRPLVIIAACEAVGGTAEAALPACCALEMVHAYSLVHDDLPAMDNDLERRGQPTVHVAFGHAGGILVGDALLSQAFMALMRGADGVPPANLVAAARVLAHHSGVDGMVGGQALDLALGQDAHDLTALEQVHALKTGALYAAAGALGALYAGADSDTVRSLETWGLKFGIAFQHADDVLDDDQKALRTQALARVDELVGECDAIAAPLGDKAEPLRAISKWVRDRAHAAAAGVKAD